MEGLILAKLMEAFFDAFGEDMVRAACDEECHRRKRLADRGRVNVEAAAEFGPLPPDPMTDT